MSTAILYFRFNSTDRLCIESQAYRPIGREEEGYLLLSEDDPKIRRRLSNEELFRLVLAGVVAIERDAFRPKRLLPRAQAKAERLNDLPQQVCEHDSRRAIYCRRFLEMERAAEATRSDASMHRAIAGIEAEINKAERAAAAKLGKHGEPLHPRADKKLTSYQPPSPRTLRRALKDLEGVGGQAVAATGRAERLAP
jgi:hypothetical protein